MHTVCYIYKDVLGGAGSLTSIHVIIILWFSVNKAHRTTVCAPPTQQMVSVAVVPQISRAVATSVDDRLREETSASHRHPTEEDIRMACSRERETPVNCCSVHPFFF